MALDEKRRAAITKFEQAQAHQQISASKSARPKGKDEADAKLDG